MPDKTGILFFIQKALYHRTIEIVCDRLTSEMKIGSIILPALLLILCQLAYGQSKVQQKIPEKTRILFLLDA